MRFFLLTIVKNIFIQQVRLRGGSVSVGCVAKGEILFLILIARTLMYIVIVIVSSHFLFEELTATTILIRHL